MTYNELIEVLFARHDAGTTTLPYGVCPKSDDIDGPDEVSATQWAAWSWNPPAGHPHLTAADSSASTKPDYTSLEREALTLRRPVGAVLDDLQREASRRISANYGESTWEAEMEVRMRGDGTVAQDTERDRLRAVYRREKARVAAMTPAQRAAYVPEADSIWAKPDA